MQYFFYKIRHNIPQDKNGVMVGKNAIIVLCVLGLISDNICSFPAIIGFIIADELGEMMDWSK